MAANQALELLISFTPVMLLGSEGQPQGVEKWGGLSGKNLIWVQGKGGKSQG